MPILKTCCKCGSLRFGSLFSAGMTIAITTLSALTILTLPLYLYFFFSVKISIFIWSLINLVFAILLIIGILKKKSVIFLPWIVMTIINIFSGLIISIALGVNYFDIKDTLNGALTISISFGTVGVTLYLWLVTLSHYQELEEQATP